MPMRRRRGIAAMTRPAFVLSSFTATTFLSALLLFSVQPMFAKMVLPVLGGSPSVWAVAIFFFQSALLVGYCYAHVLIAYASVLQTGLIHLGVCVLAMLALPIGLPAGWGQPPPGEPYLWQIGLFTAAIGVPFVALSANAPLLQAWFSRTPHRHAADPYFLYGASNLGSLSALVAYPLAVEPAIGLAAQSRIWSIGFGILSVLIACSGLLLVLGSYVGAQYLRVWRPRRRGQQAATRAEQAPRQAADIAVGGPLVGSL